MRRRTPITTPTELRFSKVHGAGNDFVLLDLRDTPAPSAELCRALADRHTGVGCDLILGVAGPRTPQAVASYAIWTADGAPSQQCGNGARCVAAWAVREGLTAAPRFALDSPSGTHLVERLDEQDWYRVDMGPPRFSPGQVPLHGFTAEQDVYRVALEDGAEVAFCAVSMGNPHAVIEVDDVAAAPVGRVGAALQGSGVLPPTVNVGFVQVESRDRVLLRVHEYGAGETRSCGSGSCAAAAVLMRRGRVARSVSVLSPGGTLRISQPDPDGPMFLAGPTSLVYEGTFHHASL
ncbi:diaminopimelate epimerase [Streptomyces avicenniae]|uniref:diaminopimelate epimerase n=1 Tax=Streptomyces avicenniae TaxID=500153 RepID=UPI00069A1A8D|nr:diaminopimelate epimerase [Streptomyces avicenniae]